MRKSAIAGGNDFWPRQNPKRNVTVIEGHHEVWS